MLGPDKSAGLHGLAACAAHKSYHDARWRGIACEDAQSGKYVAVEKSGPSLAATWKIGTRLTVSGGALIFCSRSVRVRYVRTYQRRAHSMSHLISFVSVRSPCTPGTPSRRANIGLIGLLGSCGVCKHGDSPRCLLDFSSWVRKAMRNKLETPHFHL